MEQLVIRGQDSIIQLKSLLVGRHLQRVALVCGQHVLDTHDSLFKQLAIDFSTTIVTPNGILEERLLPAFERKLLGADSIVAIGGGRTIDFGKVLLYHLPTGSVKPYFIAVPTTAGSGSEATSFAVIYKQGVKYSLDHPRLLPDLVLLDPILLEGLSTYQKAVSGIDAMAQCIESIWNKNANPESLAYAEKGLEILWNKLPSFVKGDSSIAPGIAEGAYLSGKAINITKTTGPHALSYYLTSNYGVDHGQAVATFLPLFFAYNFEDVTDEITNSRRQLIYQILNLKNQDGVEHIKKFIRGLGLSINLEDFGIPKDVVPEIIASVNGERFNNNPVAFNAERMQKMILKHCYSS
ncbi:MAG: putative alcohol dehydrogenase [Flaviaesturariibacter sp.]|nr:putative alcohol dehydrogenase [Flaviaesturariibacter sp.]